MRIESSDKSNLMANRLGFYSAISTALVTIITFTIAYLTPPLSGPLCRGSCFKYPYTDIITRFPRDYIWMYPAILLMLIFVVLMVCVHHYAQKDKKVFSQIGLSFALISAAIFITDFFIQISVIQPSLINGETEGIALLTQFNAHGVFIALEEIGYLLMSISLLFLAPVFWARSRLEKTISWIFIVSFVLTISSFIIVSIMYGINREYIFEVATISFNWLTLIISGILLSVVFYKAMKH